MAGLVVNAVKMTQHGHVLYMFSMSSERLSKVCYVTPRSEGDPKEVQRIVDVKRAKAIGEYLQEASVVLPNAIVISLSEEVTVSSTGSPGAVAITFPEEEGKFAYILDGQHRLEGFKYSGGIVFDLPVVALHKIDESLRGKIFADINSKQERVSDVHLLELYYQMGGLGHDDSATMEVIHGLEKAVDSPFHNNIRVRDDQKSRKITNKFMKRVLSPHIVSGGVLGNLKTQEQVVVLKEFFKGVQLTWPNEWGNTKEFSLSKAFGIEIVSSVFPFVLHRVNLNCGKQKTAANFEKMLVPLKKAKIVLPGGSEIPLTWATGTIGQFSSGAGRSAIARRLRDILAAADDE